MPVLDLIKVDQNKCVKCGLCVADCPACILDMGGGERSGMQCGPGMYELRALCGNLSHRRYG